MIRVVFGGSDPNPVYHKVGLGFFYNVLQISKHKLSIGANKLTKRIQRDRPTYKKTDRQKMSIKKNTNRKKERRIIKKEPRIHEKDIKDQIYKKKASLQKKCVKYRERVPFGHRGIFPQQPPPPSHGTNIYRCGGISVI